MASENSRKGGPWWLVIALPLIFVSGVLGGLYAYRTSVHTTNVMLKDKATTVSVEEVLLGTGGDAGKITPTLELYAKRHTETDGLELTYQYEDGPLRITGLARREQPEALAPLFEALARRGGGAPAALTVKESPALAALGSSAAGGDLLQGDTAVGHWFVAQRTGRLLAVTIVGARFKDDAAFARVLKPHLERLDVF
jgi:hypothetical protein